LRTKTFDFDNIIYDYNSLTSTQTEAKRLALSGIKRAIVVTKEQTNGKGRCGRNWKSPLGGGLYVSYLLTLKIHPSRIHLMNFVAGLAVVFFLNDTYGINAALKWPNDVIIESNNDSIDDLNSTHSSCSAYRKICGILSEAATNADEVKFCIVGIGINCKQEAIPPEISSCACALDEYVDNIDERDLLRGISNEFFTRVENFESLGTDKLLEEYVSHCSTIGKTVRIETDNVTINGIATGIGESGELLVETKNGVEKFSSADVFHATICKT